MTHLQSLIKNSQNQLDKIRKKTIGVFVLHYDKYLVLSLEDDVIHGVFITSLGAIHEMHCHCSNGVYYPIPDKYGSFYELLQNIEDYIEWSDFMN